MAVGRDVAAGAFEFGGERAGVLYGFDLGEIALSGSGGLLGGSGILHRLLGVLFGLGQFLPAFVPAPMPVEFGLASLQRLSLIHI